MENQANLLIVMGVSGSGKSTLSQAVAKSMGYHYLDADDFHSEEAKAWMASGKPLNDVMRAPWLARIQQYLRENFRPEHHYVLAYSGLKIKHRESFRNLPFVVRFIYLNADKALIQARLTQRKNHFFSPKLLDSQIQALEEPTAWEYQQDTLKLNMQLSISEQITAISDYIKD